MAINGIDATPNPVTLPGGGAGTPVYGTPVGSTYNGTACVAGTASGTLGGAAAGASLGGGAGPIGAGIGGVGGAAIGAAGTYTNLPSCQNPPVQLGSGFDTYNNPQGVSDTTTTQDGVTTETVIAN